MLAKSTKNLDICTMKPFQEFERRGKTVLWATPDEGKLIELAGTDPNSATVWTYHFYLEQDTEMSEPDEDGWTQLSPQSKLNGQFGDRVREIDAPLPVWQQLGHTGLRAVE